MNLSRVFASLALGSLLAGSTAFAADTYNIDTGHSTAIFRIKHFGASWQYGRFNDITGTMVFDDADATKSSFDITVKTDSVDTNLDKRDEHLKGPDFFDAAKYPTMTFKSTKVAKGTGNTYKVTGNLTLHGVTKEVTVDVERPGTGQDPWGGTRTGAEAVLTIKRSDYGISFMPDGLGDEVRLIISLEGIKK